RCPVWQFAERSSRAGLRDAIATQADGHGLIGGCQALVGGGLQAGGGGRGGHPRQRGGQGDAEGLPAQFQMHEYYSLSGRSWLDTDALSTGERKAAPLWNPAQAIHE